MVALVQALNRFAADPTERRLYVRTQVQARVQGVRLDHSLAARRQPRLGLQLHDLSLGGLSATATLPLQCGERLNLSFAPTSRSLGWDACGRVLRCEPSLDGYHVAVEFDRLSAA
jgi:hypothetical protein